MGGEDSIFHPTHILPFGSNDFHYQPDKVFQRSDVDLHIIPKLPRSGSDTLANEKNLVKVIEGYGGPESINSTYIHAPYAEQIAKAKISFVNAQDYDSVKTTLNDPSFNDFANSAYTAERGYAIRVNPITGQKEMFIAGTRTAQDWASNLLELSPKGTELIGRNVINFGIDLEDTWGSGHATPWRKRAQHEYENIVTDEHVDVIYGHSRGGAIVADMQVSDDIQKVGLDAAMIIADNKDMVNYYEAGEESGRGWTWVKSRFDAGIGLTGKDNIHMNLSKKFHHVWGD